MTFTLRGLIKGKGWWGGGGSKLTGVRLEIFVKFNKRGVGISNILKPLISVMNEKTDINVQY